LGANHKVTESSVLSGNVQFDNYSDFESSGTHDFRVRTSISDNFSVHGKYGTGFAPPEALDLFEFLPLYPGSPNLKAEESKNHEIGVVYEDEERNNFYGITFFLTKYDNLISASWDVANNRYLPAKNINKSETYGLEISFHNQITQKVHLDSSVSYAKSKNLDSNEDFLPKRPEFFGSFTATYREDEFDLGTQMNFKNKTKESSTNRNDDYFLVRLFGNYQISEQLILNARIENLFDENYEEVIGYPALGRAIHAGFTYNF
jgi:vitamin B12 transporter